MANAINQEATEKFLSNARAIQAELEALQAAVTEELSSADVNGGDVTIHWGHVGSLGHVAEKLAEINAFLNGEG